MTGWIVRHLVVLVSAATLAACGGGGGGDGTGGGAGGPAATFTRTVELTGAGALWGGPFLPGEAHGHVLLRAADVGGAGPITSIAFRRDPGWGPQAANACPAVVVALGHTSKTDLETTFANNVEEGRGSAVTVLDGPVTIPAGAAGEYFTIPFDEPFLYNGVDNLAVDIASSACDDTTWLRATATTYVSAVTSLDLSASTGSSTMSIADLKLTFTGGDEGLVVAAGTPVDSSAPFTTGGTRKLQALYLADEIDGRGPITGVGFPVGWDTSTAQTYTVTLRLAHSTALALADAYADNYADTPVTVASGATFVVPAGLTAGTYVWLPAPDGAFTYNGADNLLVEVDVSTATGVTMWRMHDPGGLVRLRMGSSGGTTAALGVTSVPDLELRFAGGAMDVPTPAAAGAWSANDGFPFDNSPGKRQYLYLGSELGGARTITGLACRLRSADPDAATYPNYTVVMSHTTATALTATFADNLPAPVTVFSGTLAVPGGHQVGDWLKIPFSTPFPYNGRDHLVVQVAGDGGTQINGCLTDLASATRYAGRRVWADDPTAPVGTGVTDSLIDMRFFLQ